MEILKKGSKGKLVKAWQEFLIGQDLLNDVADGNFGNKTFTATKSFQIKYQLFVDGKAGDETISKAMLLGFSIFEDPTDKEKSGPNWPPKPNFLPLVSNSSRQNIFGKFAYRITDIEGSIEITDGWDDENIIRVFIPQLKGVGGGLVPRNLKIPFHKLAANQLIKMWQDWEDAGLLDRVLTYAGSYVPRMVRNSSSTLSNHAFGSGFDINVAWNQYGATPALLGKKGCVRELVQIANKNGFYWGGHFTKKDGMHFEIAHIK